MSLRGVFPYIGTDGLCIGSLLLQLAQHFFRRIYSADIKASLHKGNKEPAAAAEGLQDFLVLPRIGKVKVQFVLRAFSCKISYISVHKPP